MKYLTLALLALTLGACGHATTQLDRELALKLADKPEVIVANQAAPTINIYNGGQNQAAPAIEEPSLNDTRKNCMDSPVYNAQGKFSHYTKRCFGTE